MSGSAAAGAADESHAEPGGGAVEEGEASATASQLRRRRKKAKSGNSNGQAAPKLKVCGPEFIQTLRGRLLGREVALVCCGEAHEDAIDLTRPNCVTEAVRSWVEDESSSGFNPEDALKTKRGVTLKKAKAWAQEVLEEEDEEDEDGGVLIFVGAPGTANGVASVFSSDVEEDASYPLAANATAYRWADQDLGAREFNRRRLEGEEVPPEEHDKLIAERKQARLDEGLELFDDWLLRQAGSEAARVEIILEAPVQAGEVELHEEPDVAPAPPAHECLRQLELDSDEDSEEEDDPDDGCGSFADYLRRRVEALLPHEQIHGVDPRDLGDYDKDDEAQIASLRALLQKPLPPDLEDEELTKLGAKCADPDDEGQQGKQGSARKGRQGKQGDSIPPLPSWEAYFGAAAELLYYSPHIKADYAPLLAGCFGSPQKLCRFFELLYFGTVPEAAEELALTEQSRPLTRIRSLAFRPAPDEPLARRPIDFGLVPVKAAPLDRYLKAAGSSPPRTWVSGLAQRLRDAGGDDINTAAKAWYRNSVLRFLADPKQADKDGDYFVAWLRECHRKIYDDIDRSDPEELVTMQYAESEEHPGSKKHRHNLKDIRIPNLEACFAELAAFKPEERISTRRERVIAKILVDSFQLRLVDLAAILQVAVLAAAAPEQSKLVIVLYMGSDHTKCVVDFWASQGFTAAGLPNKGLVGKDDWEDDEPRGLDLPKYLHDFAALFPVR